MQGLGLPAVFSAFVLLVGGVAAGLLIMLAECLWSRLRSRRQKAGAAAAGAVWAAPAKGAAAGTPGAAWTAATPVKGLAPVGEEVEEGRMLADFSREVPLGTDNSVILHVRYRCHGHVSHLLQHSPQASAAPAQPLTHGLSFSKLLLHDCS